MKRSKIRLTESQLHKIIKESVKRVLKEIDDDDKQEQMDWDEYWFGNINRFDYPYHEDYWDEDDGNLMTQKMEHMADAWDKYERGERDF